MNTSDECSYLIMADYQVSHAVSYRVRIGKDVRNSFDEPMIHFRDQPNKNRKG